MTTQEAGRFRKKKTSFTATSNRVLFDEGLDMDTKTLHNMINYYISIPDFTLYKAHIQKQSGVGQRAFNRMWKQLKEAGYLVQYKLKDSKGVFYYEYELLDEPQKVENILEVQNEPMEEVEDKKPQLHFAHVEEADMDNAPCGKGSTINNTVRNNTLSNKTIKNKQQQLKEKQEEVVVICDAHLPKLDDEIIQHYKHAFGRKPSPKAKESLVSFLSKFDREVLFYAFDIAGSKGKAYDYAQGILKTWWKELAFTLEQVFTYEENFNNQHI